MSLRVLLADADGTLFDFHRGEAVAIGETFRRFGIPDTPGNLEIYSRVNHAQWLRLERGETTQERLRVDRFTDFLRETGLEGDAQALCDCYVELLGRQRYILSGAKEFCRAVSARMPIYLITNGISQIQRSRFGDCAITPYLSGMVISEEVGHAKPHPAMLYQTLEMAGCAPQEAIVMGDSVTADIAAANAAGVESILFTEGKEPPEGHGATYVARTYREALDILLAKAE